MHDLRQPRDIDVVFGVDHVLDRAAGNCYWLDELVLAADVSLNQIIAVGIEQQCQAIAARQGIRQHGQVRSAHAFEQERRIATLVLELSQHGG